MATDSSSTKHPSLSQRTIANLVALGRPRLVVLSLRKEIEQALSDGLTLAEIWRQLHTEGVFPARYDRFRFLVRKLITQPSKKPERTRTTTSEVSSGFTLTRNVNPKDLV